LSNDIAIITDLHFGVKGDSEYVLAKQEEFYRDVFFPEIDKRKIRTILNLGDTFDRRKMINFYTLQKARDFFFSEIAKREIQYHAISGNHDVFYTNTNGINSIDLLLGEYGGFNVYSNEPVELEFGGLRVLMCPWLTKDNSEKSLQIIKESTASHLMGHFSIVGFEMIKGSLCDHGLDREIFKSFESVYSGHFHHPSTAGNIKYLGAPYEMNWGDVDGNRGFHILNSKTRKLTFIKNPIKIFHKIDYSESDSKWTLDEIENLEISHLKNAFTRISVKDKKDDLVYAAFVDKINSIGAADVKVIEESLSIQSVVDQNITEASDTHDIIMSYISNIEGIEEAKLEKTKKFLSQLYREALETE
jgi:DNA repair exonuclease SbcCD nuclease subunit